MRASQERAHFDNLAADTGGHWWGNLTEAGRERQRVRAAMAYALAKIPANGVVLEIGCGAGDFSWWLACGGARIVSVDISPELIKLARSRYDRANLRFLVADIGSLQFAGDSFDAVVGNSILHHVELVPVLEEVRRVLSPGGGIFFSEPNMLNPQVWVEKNVKPIGRLLQNSPEETAFTRWGIEQAIRECSFEQVSVGAFDFLHPATPKQLISPVSSFGRVLERVPIVREFGGSLKISAAKTR